MNKEKVANYSGVAKNIVDAFGSIASVFMPKAAPAVVLASEVLDKISRIDDKEAINNVLGLTAVSELLDDVITKAQNGEEIDMEALKSASENLRAIDAGLDKFYKIIS